LCVVWTRLLLQHAVASKMHLHTILRINRPGRDGRLSTPMCTAAAAEIRTCNKSRPLDYLDLDSCRSQYNGMFACGAGLGSGLSGSATNLALAGRSAMTTPRTSGLSGSKAGSAGQRNGLLAKSWSDISSAAVNSSPSSRLSCQCKLTSFALCFAVL